MKFAANISTLCQDIPKLTERLSHLLRRNDYKFTAIECQNPYIVPLDQWKETLAEGGGSSLQWVLINSPPLFDAFPDLESVPTKEEYKAKVLDPTIEYAQALKVPRVHLVMKDIARPEQILQVTELLDYGAETLEPLGITCLIEPLATRQNYYLRSYDTAIEIVKKLKRPNLKVMLDTFHLQMLHGNLTERIEATLPYTGHVQVSQAPLRNCPMMSGEINYSYVLKQLSRKYDDVIGLEYNNESIESFSWLNDFK